MPARRDLTRDAVLAAAAEMIASDGLASFSLRRLSEQLGVAAPAVSWHVGTRDALLLDLTDIVLAQIELPAGAVTPLDGLIRVACSFRQVVLDQRRLAPVVLDLLPQAPRTLDLIATVLDLLAESGNRGQDLQYRYNAYIGYIVGVTGLEVGQRSLSLRTGPHAAAVVNAIHAHSSPWVQQLFGSGASRLSRDDALPEDSFRDGLLALLRGYNVETPLSASGGTPAR